MSRTVEAIRTYRIPPEMSEYMVPEFIANVDPQLLGSDSLDEGPPLRSNLRLFPPPIFSRQNVPQPYKYIICLLVRLPFMFSLALRAMSLLWLLRYLTKKQGRRKNDLSIE